MRGLQPGTIHSFNLPRQFFAQMRAMYAVVELTFSFSSPSLKGLLGRVTGGCELSAAGDSAILAGRRVARGGFVGKELGQLIRRLL